MELNKLFYFPLLIDHLIGITQNRFEKQILGIFIFYSYVHIDIQGRATIACDWQLTKKNYPVKNKITINLVVKGRFCLETIS